ncbi:MAG: hypothetical protein ACHP9T_08455 [Caulobacterales bacterium]|jgi:hypothetical protein
MRPTLVALTAALTAGTAATAADQFQRVASVSSVFTNSKGDWVTSVWKDPDTGCEYLLRGDNIIPRLDHGGRPRCPT